MSSLDAHSESTRLDLGGASDALAHAVNRVAYAGGRVIIRRRGKDVAVLIPVEDLEFLEKQEDRLRGGRLRTVVTDVRSAIPPRRLYGRPEIGQRNGDSASRQ